MKNNIIVEKKNNVAHLVINRPEVRNALNQETIKDLLAAFEQTQKETDTKCILLYGQGQEAFCAGADLSELDHMRTLRERKSFFGTLSKLLKSMNHCPKPIVAKVHGHALAGGCGLAAACDVVLASEDASFGLPEIKIGLVPLVVMAPVHRVIGRRALQELTLTGDPITANRALEVGLVTRIYTKVELDFEAVKLAEVMATRSSEALALAKEVIYDISETNYFAALRALPDRIAMHSLGEDANEGIRAFLEKRKPCWK